MEREKEDMHLSVIPVCGYDTLEILAYNGTVSPPLLAAEQEQYQNQGEEGQSLAEQGQQSLAEREVVPPEVGGAGYGFLSR